jgi:acetyl-CoA carboxylase biotin carboxyl carrier protein
MDLKQIKELIQLLEKSGLNRLTIKDKGIEISLEKNSAPPLVESHQLIKKELPAMMHAAPEVSLKPQSQAHIEESSYDPKNCQKSPMVGMFYRSSKPSEPPFVSEGDSVEKGQVLCIIEAMKVMNEIKSERKGKVVKILAENGHPVEYGQHLFVIE